MGFLYVETQAGNIVTVSRVVNPDNVYRDKNIGVIVQGGEYGESVFNRRVVEIPEYIQTDFDLLR